jgi:ATPase subunit of ABC transporter with duplicated ATPase domains
MGTRMGFEARSSMLSAVREPALLSDPTKHDESIGARLEEGRLRLVALIERLGDLLGEHAAPLLEAASNQLHQRCCRIAVIGQIKAGKSTFINALAERPGFLPADINPWTAVVTSLHFRNSPTPPEHAAVFHLFSADQWKELAEGGGRLR